MPNKDNANQTSKKKQQQTKSNKESKTTKNKKTHNQNKTKNSSKVKKARQHNWDNGFASSEGMVWREKSKRTRNITLTAIQKI
jgi:hypothetical protein